MMDERRIILAHDALIKTVGKRSFLLRTSFDYSKQNLIELTVLGVEIVNYIKETRTITEVLNCFSGRVNEDSIIEYLDYLHKKGYLLKWGKSTFQDTSISSIQKKEWHTNHVPYGATIELTPRCNFRCVHCYLDNMHEEKILSTDQIKSILDILAKAGMLTVFLSGGEPLLRKDFEEIYLYAKKLGFLIVIFTNGYLLSEKLLETFLRYPPLEIDISLYGACDEAYKKITGVDGAFTRIVNNIKLYKKHGIFISAKTPVFTLIEDELPTLKSITKELDIPWRISFDIVPTIDNESKSQYQIEASKAVRLFKCYADNYATEIGMLEESLAKRGMRIGRRRYACGIGKSSCFVDYRGFVSPCIETRHRGISIFEEDFKNIWRKIGEISYEGLSECDVQNYKCIECNLACICKSCPAIRERYYGSPTIVKDSDCAYAKELYKIYKEDTSDGEN